METLLNKVTITRLEELHNVLCSVISEMNDAQHNPRSKNKDENYVMCHTLATRLLNVISERRSLNVIPDKSK